MTMQILDEVADDAHLSAAERVEEKLQSVDYDVWHCPGCGSVEKVRYGRWFSKYSKCPRCSAATRSKTEHVVIAATTSSSGLIRIHEHCASCGYEQTSERRIPKRSPSSRRSSGFSGGRSSGRGASGRW